MVCLLWTMLLKVYLCILYEPVEVDVGNMPFQVWSLSSLLMRTSSLVWLTGNDPESELELSNGAEAVMVWRDFFVLAFKEERLTILPESTNLKCRMTADFHLIFVLEVAGNEKHVLDWLAVDDHFCDHRDRPKAPIRPAFVARSVKRHLEIVMPVSPSDFCIDL
ncbi:hypothetical protein M409DRAFT_27663 [Zasmidium cellare ATCC 36951]|uniref:Uncharacterized protein n=1 Tax=Zasmidium cellare ATCC 36951 TaxID=1080233 RepID=A0A6A6C459_ZASCE|nr:uncharacterized protein M409DRAFT_27663 [Zasmidium cellare ATCC 36951]KAF2161937.1 hypothetical protein M409DRAFT_27663 [Zasmidium cellare ATCC 36951]